MGVPAASPVGLTSPSTTITNNESEQQTLYYCETDQRDTHSDYCYVSNGSMSVDRSQQDFRRNFAVIEQAARNGGVYPGGGVKVLILWICWLPLPLNGLCIFMLLVSAGV